MVFRIRRFRGFTLLLAALAALGVGSMSAQAAVIVVDPGVVGGPSNSPLVVGQLVPVGDPILDVLFADMKHVEVDQWGFSIVQFDPTATGRLLFDVFLTDELGAPIGDPLFGGTTLDLFRISLDVAPPLLAHDIHFGFSFSGTPVDLVIDVFVDGQVGVWAVPEPSTLTLFGAGLFGLALLARRRRKAA